MNYEIRTNSTYWSYIENLVRGECKLVEESITRSSSSAVLPFSKLSRRILFSSSSCEHLCLAKARSALTVFSSRRRSFALAAVAIATCEQKQRLIMHFTSYEIETRLKLCLLMKLIISNQC